MSTFRLTIASVSETRYEGEAVSATMPGSAGEFTILAAHEPFVTTLKKGMITVRPSGGEAKKFSIENGILECSNNRAVVLL